MAMIQLFAGHVRWKPRLATWVLIGTVVDFTLRFRELEVESLPPSSVRTLVRP